jgi:ABC-type branched-subunit amino acid transport system ATPase component
MSTLLKITGLYGGYEKDVNILQGINLTVAEGDAVGIIGLNGSGKSTLGKAVMNLIPYRSGSIVFDGQPTGNLSTHELAQLGIALMHQGGAVFPNLNVWQNLQLALGSVSRTAEAQNFVSLQSVIPLLQKPRKELMRTMADKLSGGQRHELALAMTLARRPKLVILDEPSAGLSPKAVEEMYGMLGDIRKEMGVTILLIEQNVTRAVGFCERCVMLGQGKIVKEFYLDNIDLNAIESIMLKF